MKKLIYLSLAATLWLSSCSQETMLNSQNGNGQVIFKGNMAQLQTRVNGNVWDGGEQVGIYMIKSNPGTLTTANIITGCGNKAYNASAGVSATFSPVNGIDMYYPNDDSFVKFLAYHPYSNAVTTDFKLPINLSNQTDQSAIDILYAPITTDNYNISTTTAVSLNFTHKLVKLVFKISNAEGTMTPVADGITVGIPNQFIAGALDLTDGTVATSGSIVTLTTASTTSGTTVTAEAIVFPKTGTAGTEVTFTNSAGRLYSATIPYSHTNWEAGNLYTYNITLPASLFTAASITGTITDWNNMSDSNVTGITVYDISWYIASGAASPYTIDNAAKLAGLAYLVNNGTESFDGKTINLSDDIDLNGMNWMPIGTYDNPFKGTFNGNGKEISNLTINLPATHYVGLFGSIEGVTIKKLGMVNAKIKGLNNVGGVAGGMFGGEITECYVSGEISGNSIVGGLIGGISSDGGGSISDCYTLCDVIGVSNIGGVAGSYMRGSILRCYATGMVSGSQTVGGIAGGLWNNTCYLYDCVALNKSVSYNGTGAYTNFGRVAGDVSTSATTSRNRALVSMGGETAMFTDIVHNGKDGEDISAYDAKMETSYTGIVPPWGFDATTGPWKWGTGAYQLPVLMWQTTMPPMPGHL